MSSSLLGRRIGAQRAGAGAGHPIIIAHRGASGYRPEHTLAAYWLAIRQGADFIEPDLVSTRDAVLVARHENEISSTTDVEDHPRFAGRRTSKQIDGRAVTGFFTEDFTLAELRSLRVKERLPQLRPANVAYDGQLRVPTFDEILALARHASAYLGRPVGVYPETKHPSYFAGLGLALEPPLLRSLHRHGYRGRRAPVFIQSFEVGNLERLRACSDLALVQLLEIEGTPQDCQAGGPSYAELASVRGLQRIARYADAVGVHKDLLIPRDAAGRLSAATPLLAAAREAGLCVHAWTFRAENAFVPLEFRRGRAADPAQLGDLSGECTRFLELGVDGLFCDQPELGARARARWLAAADSSRSHAPAH